MKDIDDRFQEAKKIYETLRGCKMVEFASFLPSMIPDKTPGVYAIYEERTMETLYVGKTTNLRQRLYYNHLMGPANNARLKKYIMEDTENFPEIKDMESAKRWIKDNCCFQFVVCENFRERGHIEGLLSFLLNARYVDKEH